jgi:hypothetical protein
LENSEQTIVLIINPEKLSNPDLDIRYLLPEMLEEQSNGLIKDDGYDYLDDEINTMLVFLKISDFEKAIACIEDAIENVSLLGNNLKQGVIIAVEKEPGVRNFKIVRQFD